MGRTPVDITGQRFGKLTVVRLTGEKRYGSLVWLCRCDCGGEALKTRASLTEKHKIPIHCRDCNVRPDYPKGKGTGRGRPLGSKDKAPRKARPWRWTPERLATLRSQRKAGLSLQEIATKHGVSKQLVARLLRTGKSRA